MTENNNGFIERQNDSAGMGQWSHISKTEWKPAERTDWILPVTQQCFISVTRGAIGIIAGLSVATCSALNGGQFWPIVGLATVGSVAYTLYHFSAHIGDRFETMRIQQVREEVYEKESRAAASQSSDRIVIESHEKHGASVHTVYDELAVSAEILSKVTTLRELSTRSLQEVGVPSNTALQLMDSLTKLGFVVREKTNKPGKWSSKGMSLVHHFNPQYALECNDN